MAKKLANTFEVPSLESSSPEYAGLIAKRQELEQGHRDLVAERSRLRKEIEAAEGSGGQRLSPGVAALLGDKEDSVTALSLRLCEVFADIKDNEAATEILRRRLGDARDRASKIIRDGVRQEYASRVAAVTKAAAALHEARMNYLDLRWQFEAEDVSWTALGPLSIAFLGDHTDGHLVRLIRDGGANV